MSNEQNLDLTLSSHTGAVDTHLREQVQRLAADAQAHDSNPPLSDQTFIDLAQANAHGLVAVFAHTPGEVAEQGLVGTAIAVRASRSDPWTVELVVAPEARGHSVATDLLELLQALIGDLSTVQSWAHGDHPGAQALARRYGLSRQRDLNKMRRDSTERLLVGELPEELTLRSFSVGQDEQAWLRANAAAFADHPEQGGLTIDDLQARIAEPWFDAEGFFLAVDPHREIQAFHWTKLVEPESAEAQRIGEVYVVGVRPTAQGMGLGKILTARGINHLLDRGVVAVMLYVDANNTSAVKLYKSLGFTVWDVDVMYGPAR